MVQLPVEAQVEHERGGGVQELLPFAQLPPEVSLSRRAGQELPVYVRKVGVREHGVGSNLFAVHAHPARPTIRDRYLFHGAVQVDAHPEVAGEPDHRLDELIHAAAGKPEAILSQLGVRQQCVDRRCLEGREPEVHGLERERLPQLFCLEELRDGAVVVVHGPRLEEELEITGAEEVASLLEVALDELAAAEAVLEAGVSHKAVEAWGDARL
jgi:hypothetical protein